MVTEAGAKQAQPLIVEIDKLESYIANLEKYANPGDSAIWKLEIQLYQPAGVSHTITIIDDLNAADSTAILFDIRNILGTKLTILNNELASII